MADARALKKIGMAFAAATLAVMSTALVMVAAQI